MEMAIKAIETVYKKYRFRSRLEARWAVFFDALGIKWEYETEGYVLPNGERYLPDFWLQEWGCFAEVKSGRFAEAEFIRCAYLPHPCLLLEGMPADKPYWVTSVSKSLDSDWVRTGVQVEYFAYDRNDAHGHTVHLFTSRMRGRLWYMLGEEYACFDHMAKAVASARAARFEFGESGSGVN